MTRQGTKGVSSPIDNTTSSVIVLGVHFRGSQLIVPRSFKYEAKSLLEQINLPRSWLGIPYPEIQDDDETHLRIGVFASASARSGAVRGFLKRICRAGVEVALYCPDNSQREWSLVRVSPGRFQEVCSIGRFEESKIDSLVSLLISQAPILESVYIENPIELPSNPQIELCSEPERGFFSMAHVRYVQRRRAALEAAASQTAKTGGKECCKLSE